METRCGQDIHSDWKGEKGCHKTRGVCIHSVGGFKMVTEEFAKSLSIVGAVKTLWEGLKHCGRGLNIVGGI